MRWSDCDARKLLNPKACPNDPPGYIQKKLVQGVTAVANGGACELHSQNQ